MKKKGKTISFQSTNKKFMVLLSLQNPRFLELEFSVKSTMLLAAIQ